MFRTLDADVTVAVGTAVGTGFAFALNSHLGGIVNARRDFNIAFDGIFRQSAAAAVRTRVFDNLAGSVTFWADALHREKSLRLNDLSAAVAVRTRFRFRPGFGAGSGTGFAMFVPFECNSLFDACCRFFERQLDKTNI